MPRQMLYRRPVESYQISGPMCAQAKLYIYYAAHVQRAKRRGGYLHVCVILFFSMWVSFLSHFFLLLYREGEKELPHM